MKTKLMGSVTSAWLSPSLLLLVMVGVTALALLQVSQWSLIETSEKQCLREGVVRISRLPYSPEQGAWSEQIRATSRKRRPYRNPNRPYRLGKKEWRQMQGEWYRMTARAKRAAKISSYGVGYKLGQVYLPEPSYNIIPWRIIVTKSGLRPGSAQETGGIELGKVAFVLNSGQDTIMRWG